MPNDFAVNRRNQNYKKFCTVKTEILNDDLHAAKATLHVLVEYVVTVFTNAAVYICEISGQNSFPSLSSK